MVATYLDRETLLTVIEHTPLVSIDVIVADDQERVLMGLRNNEPAKDSWFVPGGRICKDETLEAAFLRITADELGIAIPFAQARFTGVFEHIYDSNFAERAGFGTHYVVLGYQVHRNPAQLILDEEQHREYRWFSEAEARADKRVHPKSLAHFDAL